jgi:hypothetical protein
MELSRPVRRLAAITLLVAPPLLLMPLLAAPFLAAREEQAARMERALLLEARARATEARAPALAAELEALRRALAGVAEPVVLGATHALAGAELQRRLREAVARHGGSVTSLETLPEGSGGEGTLALRARLQAEPAGLRALLAELETGNALLQVPELVLSPVSASAARRGVSLEVQMELRGLRQAEAAR